MRRISRVVLACVAIGLLVVGAIILRQPDAPLAASPALPSPPVVTTTPPRPELGYAHRAPATTPRAPLRLPTSTSLQPTETTAGIPVYGYRVLKAYPHDRQAFTQGLVFQDGVLYESTGLYGRSSLRTVEIETGKVLQQVAVADKYFAEGLALVDTRLIQLTWQSHIGFVYARDTFEQIGTFDYPSEGWGLAYDGARLIMSDGTSTLHMLDPQTLQEIDQLIVTAEGEPVMQLNELEMVEGELWANIWQTDRIARIDLATGQVMGWVDLSGLLTAEDRAEPVDVLNGIAYDAGSKSLYVTGKLWPRLFQIELVPPEGAIAPVRLPLVLQGNVP